MTPFRRQTRSASPGPATKHNYLVKQSEDLARVVHEAFYVARSGRPGPVVIDLPKDILIKPAPYVAAPSEPHRSYRPQTEPDAAQIDKAVALIRGARRPILYIGGGLINAGPEASALLRELVAETGIPCTKRSMGLGALPASDPHFLGHAGHARHLRSQYGDARLRRDDQHRRPLR